jgi:predicted SprT family Zn-dependent metalloprotease
MEKQIVNLKQEVSDLRCQLEKLALRLEKIEKTYEHDEEPKMSFSKRKLIELLKKNGLYNQGWRYKFVNSTTATGMTFHGEEKIGLSKNFIHSEKTTKEEIVNVILHEIAHAIVGAQEKHNEVWLSKALEIGCDGKVKSKDFNEYKYVFRCKKGCEIRRMRMTKKLQKQIDESMCEEHSLDMKLVKK